MTEAKMVMISNTDYTTFLEGVERFLPQVEWPPIIQYSTSSTSPGVLCHSALIVGKKVKEPENG